MRRNELPRARAYLQQALHIRELAGDVRATAGTRLLIGSTAGRLGDTAAARLAYAESRETFARIGDRVSEAVVLGSQARLAFEQGLPLSADSLYGAALQRLGARAPASVTWWLRLGRGEMLRARRSPAAGAEFRASIADIERSSGAFVLPDLKAAFMADKWQPYAQLAQLEQSGGRAESAFAVSERMRTQEMLDLMTTAAPDRDQDRAGDTEARDLRQRITQLTLRLGDPEAERAAYRGEPRPPDDQAVAREALADAEDRYARALEALREGRGSAGSLVPRAPVSASDVRGRLRQDEAFLEYLVSDSTTLVFVLTADSIAGLDLHVGAKALTRLIDFARGTMSSGASADEPLLAAPLGGFTRFWSHRSSGRACSGASVDSTSRPTASFITCPFPRWYSPARSSAT